MERLTFLVILTAYSCAGRHQCETCGDPLFSFGLSPLLVQTLLATRVFPISFPANTQTLLSYIAHSLYLILEVCPEGDSDRRYKFDACQVGI